MRAPCHEVFPFPSSLLQIITWGDLPCQKAASLPDITAFQAVETYITTTHTMSGVGQMVMQKWGFSFLPPPKNREELWVNFPLLDTHLSFDYYLMGGGLHACFLEELCLVSPGSLARPGQPTGHVAGRQPRRCCLLFQKVLLRQAVRQEPRRAGRGKTPSYDRPHCRRGRRSRVGGGRQIHPTACPAVAATSQTCLI